MAQVSSETTKLQRAQGCIMGQFVGDALGSQVEFMFEDEIKAKYPNGVRNLSPGGVWETLAGQPTDDSELAMELMLSLIEHNTYNAEATLKNYKGWIDSEPFDCGSTISQALFGIPRPDSEANGALMRVSPLGVFGSNFEADQVAQWARLDCELTHINPVCVEANALFAVTISYIIANNPSLPKIKKFVDEWLKHKCTNDKVKQTVKLAYKQPPTDYSSLSGWVLLALQNAFYQLFNATDLQTGLINSVSKGGDTDTNGAITGALLGAFYGIDSFPGRWTNNVIDCRPERGKKGVKNPRPERYWPVNILTLTEKLLG